MIPKADDWPAVVIDNKELNMERVYMKVEGELKFKVKQIKSIQALSYGDMIEAIKIPNKYEPELVEWELQRRENIRTMTQMKVDELNAELKRNHEQKQEQYRQFLHRQVNKHYIYCLGI